MAPERQTRLCDPDQLQDLARLFSEARARAIGALSQQQVTDRARDYAEDAWEANEWPYNRDRAIEVPRMFLAHIEQSRYWSLSTLIARLRLRAIAFVLGIPWIEVLLVARILSVDDLEAAGWQRVPIAPADVVVRLTRFLAASGKLDSEDAARIAKTFNVWNGWKPTARVDERIREPPS